MTTTEQTYQGPWRSLINRSAQGTGNSSIHDDKQAQSLGFRRGFVVGSTVGTAAFPAVVQRFGARWFEGGWYTLKFVTPVYDDDEIREIGEPGDNPDEQAVRVENRDGRLCCTGRAGLGTKLPWDPAQDGTRSPDQVLPRIDLGREYGEMDVTITVDDVRGLVNAAREASPWYTQSSPLGLPLVPPQHLVAMNNRARLGHAPELDGVKPQPIWAEHSIVMYHPVFLDTPYRASGRIVDKGLAGRAAFITEELELRDLAGETLARARAQTKWLFDK